MLHFPTSRRHLSIYTAAAVSTLFLLLLWQNQERMGRAVVAAYYSPAESDEHIEGPSCSQLPGAEDVLVVMKTGANEVQDKLTVHLQTSLTCYPNYVIFSDYEEILKTGQHLIDAFTYTSPSIKETHKDFDLWRKLQADGRPGISPSEQSGTDSREKPENIRKKVPGWQLDKWKFLPMVNQTLHLYPDKHWYVFLEVDTYLLWSSLLPYLAGKSWIDDHYVGSKVVIEELGFAHGGTGFLISRPALEKVVKLFNNEQEQWEDYTNRYWVGDHILGAALHAAGVDFEDDRPTWQGLPLAWLDFRPTGDVWCSIALTSHHQLPMEIDDLWKFEQAWILDKATSNNGSSNLLRHQDILQYYVLPRIQQTRLEWDNRAEALQNTQVTSLQECEALCEEVKNCMQYALHENGDCRTTSKVMLGEASEGTKSGWMQQRIQAMLDGSDKC